MPFDPSQLAHGVEPGIEGSQGGGWGSNINWGDLFSNAGKMGAGAAELGGGGGAISNKYFNQMSDLQKQYLNPYVQGGQNAMGQLQGQYGNMINDPGALYARLGQGYKQSPGFQWNMNQGMNAASNAAASGGMTGSPQHQQQAAEMAEGLASKDYNNYMQSVMGLYGGGIQGLEGMNEMGYKASGSLADSLSSILYKQAQNKALAQQSKHSAWGTILGAAGGAAGAFFGGPGGAMAGYNLGSSVGGQIK